MKGIDLWNAWKEIKKAHPEAVGMKVFPHGDLCRIEVIDAGPEPKRPQISHRGNGRTWQRFMEDVDRKIRSGEAVVRKRRKGPGWTVFLPSGTEVGTGPALNPEWEPYVQEAGDDG